MYDSECFVAYTLAHGIHFNLLVDKIKEIGHNWCRRWVIFRWRFWRTKF